MRGWSANSWPLLQRYWSNVGVDGGRATALVVANGGVGPAKIEAFELFWKGRPMHSEGRAGAMTPAEEALEVNSVQGMILRAGATLRAYELPETPVTEAVATRLRATKPDLTLRACYCSVFDECWVSDLRTLQPARVTRCEAPKVPFLSKRR